MDDDCHSSSTKNEAQLTLERRSIEIVKGIENGCKLTPGERQLSELTRRSYNEHLGSINFINLLDGDSTDGREHLKANIKSFNLVSNVLDSDEDGTHTNEKQNFCLPSRNLINKGRKSSGSVKSVPLRNQVEPMDIVSQSDFASQTLKPFSMQNLELVALEKRQVQSKNTKYKLKESSPGCLPGKGKSKKLQKQKENGRMNLEKSGGHHGENDERSFDGGESVTDNSSDNNCGSGKTTRRKSFLSALKFIKLRKFGKKKKQEGQVDFCQASSSSTWESDSAQSSSEEQKHESPAYQDDDFVFGGVRVFIDKNGECYEVDENFDAESNQSTVSEDDSRSSITSYARTKFESRDSLNLGYSGCFVSSEIVEM